MGDVPFHLKFTLKVTHSCVCCYWTGLVGLPVVIIIIGWCVHHGQLDALQKVLVLDTMQSQHQSLKDIDVGYC